MIASALMALALAARPPAAAILPTGPWYVRAEDDMCLLERRYVVGARTISLVFQPMLDLPTMEIFIIDPGRGGSQYQGRYSVTVGSDEPLTGRYFSVVSTKTKSRLTRLSIERRMFDGLKDGDTLHIEARPVDLDLAVVRPEKARSALQGCTDSLKKDWGLDPAVGAQAVTPLEGNPARYFGSDAYPEAALRQGIYGRVIALLSIDPAGTVSNCRIVSSAGAELNEGTCTAARRIRFKPPVDKDGKPLPSSYLLPVRWVMPGAPDF